MTDNEITAKNFKKFYEAIYPYLSGNVKIAGPVGMIISYMGTTAPSGYLACDGSWYDIGLYPKLANWMMNEFGSYSYFALSGETVQSGKFKVPDLRGEFLRGTGTNVHASQGSGASVGVHQDGTEAPFLFISTERNFFFGSPNSGTQVSNMDKLNRTGTNRRSYVAGNVSDYDDYMSYTSRPTNTSVLYCIKYEEYEGDGRGVQYSTEEQVIGTWIDGKPLYQKTAMVTLPIASTLTITNTSITGIDVLISLEGEHLSSNGWTQPIYGTRDSHIQIDPYISDTGTLCFNHLNDTQITSIVTAKYTKTT